MIKIALIGFGRMGREILKQSVVDGLKVVCVVDAPGSALIGKDAGSLAGIEPIGVLVTGSEGLSKDLDRCKPDVVMDFSSPQASMKNSKTAAEKGLALVIGTTGFTDKETAALKELVKKNGVGAVVSPNMSIGVNVFWKLVERAASMLPDYDIEIIEKHHRFKKDAPSGTALKTAEVIEKCLDRQLGTDAVYGRSGLAERKKNEIGIHAIRAGDIVGEHTVLYGTLGERIEITHTAQSRASLAKGAVEAAKYVEGRKGFYDMEDVLGLK